MENIINYRKFFGVSIEVEVDNCGLCACSKDKVLDGFFFLCFILFLIHVIGQTTVLSLEGKNIKILKVFKQSNNLLIILFNFPILVWKCSI